MGPRYEEAFREHLRRMAGDGAFGDEVTAVGPFWTRGRDQIEIDAVVLAGAPESAVVVGECTWSARVSGTALRAQLAERSRALPRLSPELRYAVCARDRVDDATGCVPITAADIFA